MFFLSNCHVKRHYLLPLLHSWAWEAIPTLCTPVVAPTVAGVSHLAFLLSGQPLEEGLSLFATGALEEQGAGSFIPPFQVRQ